MTLAEGTSGFWQRRRLELFLFLIAFGARAGAGMYLAPDGDSFRYPDEEWYWRTAESVRAGDGLVGEYGHRASRMPLYPSFLALFADCPTHIQWARVTQWFVGALGALFVLWLGEAIRCRAVGAWAALMFALDPALCGSASLILTETVFVTVMAALWWASWPRVGVTTSRMLSVAAMVAAMGCVLTRESSLAMIVLLSAWLVVVGWRQRNNRIAIRGCLILMATGSALFGWGYRNSVVLGQWQFLTTRGGISLFDGVKPGATGASDLADHKADPAVVGLSEVEWNRHFVQKSYDAVAADPLRIAGLVPKKLARTWSPIPNAGDLQSSFVRLIFGCWYVPIALMVMVGMWSIRGNAVTLIGCLIPAICISVIHSVYVGSLRYRLAAIPTLAVLAAIGVTLICARVWRPSPDSNTEVS